MHLKNKPIIERQWALLRLSISHWLVTQKGHISILSEIMCGQPICVVWVCISVCVCVFQFKLRRAHLKSPKRIWQTPIFNPHLLSTSIHPINIICWFAATHIYSEAHMEKELVFTCVCVGVSLWKHARALAHSHKGMQSGIITASSALSSERAGQ